MESPLARVGVCAWNSVIDLDRHTTHAEVLQHNASLVPFSGAATGGDADSPRSQILVGPASGHPGLSFHRESQPTPDRTYL
jgi:hypothetical protein